MMKEKIIALFVEGPTEIEFYTSVVKFIHDKMGNSYDCSFKWFDMHGIGNYKTIVLRKFNALQISKTDADIFAILCIDTDVFEFSKKPPLDKSEIKKDLINAGAKNVIFIEAKTSIEDWFLIDFDGVLSYLRLPKSTKRPEGNGQQALKKLFKKANKLYVKGEKTEGFINKLDISKIVLASCKALSPLCSLIGACCKKVCNKTEVNNTSMRKK